MISKIIHRSNLINGLIWLLQIHTLNSLLHWVSVRTFDSALGIWFYSSKNLAEVSLALGIEGNQALLHWFRPIGWTRISRLIHTCSCSSWQLEHVQTRGAISWLGQLLVAACDPIKSIHKTHCKKWWFRFFSSKLIKLTTIAWNLGTIHRQICFYFTWKIFPIQFF